MEHIDIDFAILKSEKVSKEVKINLILEMLHLKQITLKKKLMNFVWSLVYIQSIGRKWMKK